MRHKRLEQELRKPLLLPRPDGLQDIRTHLADDNKPLFHALFYALVYFCHPFPLGNNHLITRAQLNTFVLLTEQDFLCTVFTYLYASHIIVPWSSRTNSPFRPPD